MEKMAKRFKRISKPSKDKYIIPDTLWQRYWQTTVNEAIDEIVNWISEHEKYVEPLEKAWQEAVEQTLKEAKAKKKEEPKATIAGKPEVLRYELSNDKVGLVAYLPGGNSYHIHSNELTPEQRLIKIQLLGMEG